MIKKFFPVLSCFLFVLSELSLYSQNQTTERLAHQYFQEKEFLKAAELYEQLYEKKTSTYFYRQYIQCLFELGENKTAEKFIKKEFKKNPDEPYFNVDIGYLYQLEGDANKANKHYASIINNLKADRNKISNTANAFISRALYSHALETYKKGKDLLKGNYNFSIEIANLHYAQGNYNEMTEEYLNILDENFQSYSNYVQQRLQDFVSQDDAEGTRIDIVRNALLNRIKKFPDKTFYTEMLLWLLIQQKDFSSALMQAKSLDRRMNEDGIRVLQIARLSAANKDYDVAIDAYNYVLAKGEVTPYYFDSRIELINTRYSKITEDINYTQQELLNLQKDYNTAIIELGRNSNTVPLIKNLARLEAFYLYNDSLAIALLNEAIAMRGIRPIDKADCKIELADIYLMTGDVWEATLLYSQVEKDENFKNEPIGHLAKFKNAKLSYYIGEFDWAKAQLNVLKAATSKLIANDAMELSLLISDNVDPVDSSTNALAMFALADLHYFRNKKDYALLTLDTLIKVFSYHPIIDDVHFKKAQILMSMKRFNEADSIFAIIAQTYAYDILADDALFNRALIQEDVFHDIEKAMELYQDLLIEYPGSLYSVEARRRFRYLRGDITE